MKKSIFVFVILTFFLGCKKSGADVSTAGKINDSSQTSVSYNISQSPEIKERVSYRLKKGDAVMFNRILEAEVNGKVYELVSNKENICMVIDTVMDFDLDGYSDAFIENIEACGGNCCPNSFFFYSYKGNGNFSRSDNFADSWEEPIIEKWQNKMTVKIKSVNAGMNVDAATETYRRFILNDGMALKVEQYERRPLASEIEMTSDEFDISKFDEYRYIAFDLDSDGIKDTILGTLWNRWGIIRWEVRFADGKIYKDGQSKRIGLLKSKSKGVYDLVGDFDDVYKWDGSTYKLTK